jgi:hypothetical protein
MANVTYTVPNKNGSYDGDYVVKQYTTIDIDAGDTVTVDQPCRGLMLLCTGDCNINGTLSMNSRGALANPTTSGGSDSNTTQTSGLQLPFLTSGGSSSLTADNTLMNGCGTEVRTVVSNFKTISSNGTILQITRTGGGDTDTADAQATTAGGTADVGTSGTNHTGGGGQGSGGKLPDIDEAGSGSSGTCFSGGSGGGGANGSLPTNSTASITGKNATSYGGAGGIGWSQHTARCTGGAGNPNGTESTQDGYGGASNISSGQTGTGGVIWLIVGGNLTIGASGIIKVNGSQPDGVDGNGYTWLSTGGGSGGGAVRIAHKGSFTNNGTINVAGGEGGSLIDGGNFGQAGKGGTGGVGTLTVLQVE